MKAILEFNLPEDQDQYDHANRALDYYCAISDMMEYLRGKIKYTEEIGSFEEVRDTFIGMCNNRGIDW